MLGIFAKSLMTATGQDRHEWNPPKHWRETDRKERLMMVDPMYPIHIAKRDRIIKRSK